MALLARLATWFLATKKGKTLINRPKGSIVMLLIEVNDYDSQLCLSISNEGRMLISPLSTLPKLSKGKGNKIINILSSRVQSRG